jgi:signal transduction histidine kinase
MDQRTVRDRLLAHRSAAVDAWFRGVANTSFSPRPLAEIRARLNELTTLAIEALLDDPFPDTLAHSIGAAVADLHYLNPRALVGTVRALGHELTATLSEDEARALQPRLVEVLAAVAGGFYAASRAAILQEQDEVRAALFVTRQQAEAADEARAAAETMARARSEVLGHVVHDLRSPLTSIKGQAELIAQRAERESLPFEWLRSGVKSIRTASERMQAMLGELLDAARLQVGEELELNLEYVDVMELVRPVVQRTERMGRTVALDVHDEPGMAWVDPARFERALENLLSNAVKYSGYQTPIDVTVRHDGDSVSIAVRDQGVGIPADELARVTTPFYRASTARAIPGIGLGLSGVKAIVRQHGGRLAIDSVNGEGTTVTISLPVGQRAGQPAPGTSTGTRST